MSLEDILGKDGKPLPDKVKAKLSIWMEQLKECYSFWKENEKEKPFSPGYLTTDERLNKELNNLGQKVYQQTYVHLGNIDNLIQQAPKQIQKDFQKKGYTIGKALEDLKKCYWFWKENETEKPFSPSYIRTDERLNKELDKLGQNLYVNTLLQLKSLDKLIEQAPKYIQQAYTKKEQKKFSIEQALEDLKKCYWFWKQNETDKPFIKWYMRDDEKLNKQLNNIGKNLCQKVRNNLGSFEALMQQAPKYIQQAYPAENPRNFTIENAIEELKTCYWFWKENETEKRFSLGYIQKNEKLNKELNYLGRNLSSKTFRNLGSFDALIQQAPKYIQQNYNKRERKIFSTEQALEDLKTCYEFWKENETQKLFILNYIARDKKLNEELNKLGQNLYANTHRHIGMDELVKLSPSYIQEAYFAEK